MRRFTLVVLFLIMAVTVVQAQTPAAPATRPPAAPAAVPAAPTTPPVPGTKIAVIDFEGALLDSDAGKAAQAQYLKEIDPEKNKFEKAQKELADLQTKLQNAKTEAERLPINRDIETKTLDAQRAQQDAQRMSDDLKARLLNPIAGLVNKMVEEYGKANDIAVIIDPSTDGTNIVFASKSTDITSEIMRMMNAAYAKDPKLALPASPVPAAPAKANP